MYICGVVWAMGDGDVLEEFGGEVPEKVFFWDGCVVVIELMVLKSAHSLVDSCQVVMWQEAERSEEV